MESRQFSFAHLAVENLAQVRLLFEIVGLELALVLQQVCQLGLGGGYVEKYILPQLVLAHEKQGVVQTFVIVLRFESSSFCCCENF